MGGWEFGVRVKTTLISFTVKNNKELLFLRWKTFVHVCTLVRTTPWKVRKAMI
jgi:hypothetical protein